MNQPRLSKGRTPAGLFTNLKLAVASVPDHPKEKLMLKRRTFLKAISCGLLAGVVVLTSPDGALGA